MKTVTPIEARFWPKVKRSRGCWEWIGGKTSHGYGMLGNGRRGAGNIYAHRLSFRLHYGPIPAGRLILHRCNNFACVNPAHLYVGTYADNLNQAWADGLRGR
jgi:HNH endonuclease